MRTLRRPVWAAFVVASMAVGCLATRSSGIGAPQVAAVVQVAPAVHGAPAVQVAPALQVAPATQVAPVVRVAPAAPAASVAHDPAPTVVSVALPKVVPAPVVHVSATGGPVTGPAKTPIPATASRLTLGVYAGPDSKGVVGAERFGALTGAAPGAVLDFGGTDSWSNITAPSWLIAPHATSSARFEYAMPMLPNGTQYTLAACSAGAYNAQWRIAATNLVAHHLSTTIVRPGWEFNGGWYHWSAKSDIAGFIGCYRNIVTVMRSVAGQHFAFDWNPTVGKNSFPAELAYPGDAYVDFIGVDVYDTSWTHYPVGAEGAAAAQAAAWNDDLNGDHGLKFWSTFAMSHAKPMAIVEWGVTQMTNGHGGGDDVAFVDHMFDFMTDPANNVAYEHYFNTGSAADDHTLTGDTKFPQSAAEYLRRVRALNSR